MIALGEKFSASDVGVKVWSYELGPGVMAEFVETHQSHPVMAHFKGGKRIVAFTEDGKYRPGDMHPALFRREEVPYHGQIMEVSHDNLNWSKRVVFQFGDSWCIAWGYAESHKDVDMSIMPVIWRHRREFDPNKEVNEKIADLQSQIETLKKQLI